MLEPTMLLKCYCKFDINEQVMVNNPTFSLTT